MKILQKVLNITFLIKLFVFIQTNTKEEKTREEKKQNKIFMFYTILICLSIMVFNAAVCYHLHINCYLCLLSNFFCSINFSILLFLYLFSICLFISTVLSSYINVTMCLYSFRCILLSHLPLEKLLSFRCNLTVKLKSTLWQNLIIKIENK